MPQVEFGADGIRGIAGDFPFTSSAMVRIGQALGQYLKKQVENPWVVIGRDPRPSGESYMHCLSAGLISQGVHVVKLGIMTTPGVAFITMRGQANMGIVISASHNPIECNGIKIIKQNGLRPQRNEEKEMEDFINGAISQPISDVENIGQETEGQHLVELYIQDHVMRFPLSTLHGLKVVLDCSNGAASRIAPEVFKRLSAEIIVQNDNTEGKGINDKCGSEYVSLHPDEMSQTIQKHEAVYGFAFDGDGDRLIVVDAAGNVYDGNELLYILAWHYHSTGLLRGNVVVTIHNTNCGLADALEKFGVKTIFVENGDKNLEAAMWGGDYLLGGEPGGNIIINDGYHNAADGVYTAIILSGILMKNRPAVLSDLIKPLRKRALLERKVELQAPLTQDQREHISKQVNQFKKEMGQLSRVLFWDSHTEPGVVRVLIEGCPDTPPETVLSVTEQLCEFIRHIAQEQVFRSENFSKKLDLWLDHMGLSENPFEHWKSDDDQDLPSYFIDVEFFDDLLNLPDPCVIFAGKGCGKTAQRKMLEAELQRFSSDNRRLVIEYTFDGIQRTLDAVGGDLSRLKLKHHIDSLMELGLQALYKERKRSSQIDHHFAEPEIANLFASFAANYAPTLEIPNPVEGQYHLENFAPVSLLKTFVKLVRAAGFSSCMVFIDGLDELPVMTDQPEQMIDFLKPLLGTLPIIEQPGITFRFFLPKKLEQTLSNSEWFRSDRIRIFSREWSEATLAALLNERLTHHSGRRYSYHLEKLCKPPLDGVIMHELAELSGGVPRSALRLAYSLIRTHCKKQGILDRIDQETWEQVKRDWQSGQGLTQPRTGPEEMPFQPREISSKGLFIDKAGGVYIDGQTVIVHPQDFKVLSCLYESPGKLVSYEVLIPKAWPTKDSAGVSPAAISASVARLREAFKTASGKEYIEVQRGRGLTLYLEGSPEKE